MDRIAVLLPRLNEGQTIYRVVKEFKRNIPDAVIYVYDNNSTDNTVPEALRAGAVIRNEPVQGKGSVLRRMFREVDAMCYILCDGDHTYNVENAKEMADMILNQNYDMVIGDRLTGGYREENSRRFHEFGNDLVRTAIHMLFKTKLSDIMSGYRALSYEFVKTFPVLSSGFTIETEMSIHALDKRMAVASIPVSYTEREAGSQSKLHTFRDGVRVLFMIFRLFFHYRPLACMTTGAAFLWFVSGILLYPLWTQYLAAGNVPRFPTLIVCGFMILTGIQMVLSGMMLQNRVRRDRQEFELKLMEADSRKKLLNFHQQTMKDQNI